MANQIKMSAEVWGNLCKELGIDPDVCMKITIEITYGEPIRVFPEMFVRKGANLLINEEPENKSSLISGLK